MSIIVTDTGFDADPDLPFGIDKKGPDAGHQIQGGAAVEFSVGSLQSGDEMVTLHLFEGRK